MRALHRRDALWAAALQTAIARRSGDSGAMQQHWYAAMEVLAEYSIDLFSLLPLGELWVAAARMRQVDRLRHALDDAFAVLAAAGDPVLWSVPLHWAGVHAGILANSPDAVAPHGQALTAAAAHSSFAKALATRGSHLAAGARQPRRHRRGGGGRAGAGAVRAHLGRHPARRPGRAADLRRPGVAGDAAARARPQAVGRRLPTCRSDPAPGERPGSPAPHPAPARAAAQLSDREREVAELLLQGMPYRDIGAQLFISAKTVEHHVARIRRRLGAESRSEMLSMLRAMLAPSGLTPATELGQPLWRRELPGCHYEQASSISYRPVTPA